MEYSLYGLVLLVCLWFFIHGGIIIYAYWFFSYLTELGPAELRQYIDRFRKSDYAVETHMIHNYHNHVGGHKQSLQAPKFGARLPTVAAAHMKRERSLMNTPEVGALFSDDSEDVSSPKTPAEC